MLIYRGVPVFLTVIPPMLTYPSSISLESCHLGPEDSGDEAESVRLGERTSRKGKSSRERLKCLIMQTRGGA